jgi:hypothetical protein
MLKAFREIVWAALPSAACGLALHFVFDFSTRQSVGIFCILWLLIRSIHSLAQNFSFKPHALRVEIHLPILLTDLGLIDSPADWTPYRERAKADGFDHEHFRIYAISPWLFATNVPYEPYIRRIDIRSRIEQISVPVTHASNPYSSRSPEIWFGGWKHWFVLQVIVPEDWEQELRSRFPGARVDTEYGEYDKIGSSVTLAAFPSRYLQHVIEYYEPSNFLWKWRDRRFSRWLEARGWDRDDESPEYIRHKYISVSINPLDPL